MSSEPTTRNPLMSCVVIMVHTQLDHNKKTQTTVTMSFQQDPGREWPKDAPNTFFDDVTFTYEGHPKHLVGDKIDRAYDKFLDLLGL